MCVCVYVHVNVCVRARTCMCVHVHVHVMHVCVHVHVHVDVFSVMSHISSTTLEDDILLYTCTPSMSVHTTEMTKGE